VPHDLLSENLKQRHEIVRGLCLKESSKESSIGTLRHDASVDRERTLPIEELLGTSSSGPTLQCAPPRCETEGAAPELGRLTEERTSEFDAIAIEYDRY
jgi:hypothetical protein